MRTKLFKRLITAALAGVMAVSLVPAAALNVSAATTDSTVIGLGASGIYNANLYQYAVMHFDANKDGKLTVGEAKKATSINIVSTKITSLKGIYWFENLESLTIQNCGMSSAHSDIGKLTKLENLNLSYNKLKTLPSSVKNLTNLVTVDLSGNKLPGLPTATKTWKKVTSLNVSHNLFKQLPTGSIPYMSALKKLDLSYNSLANNTSTLNSKLNRLKYLKKMEVLDLSHNKLTKFPSTPVNAMTKLKEFYINDNAITSISSYISKCTNLRILDASNNKISSVHSYIAKCTKLTKLNLANNKLSSIPNLKKLTKLVCTDTDYYALNLCGNKLSQSTIRKYTNTKLNDNWVKRQTTKTFVPIEKIAAKPAFVVEGMAVDMSNYFEFNPKAPTYQKVKYEVVNTSDGIKASLKDSLLSVTKTKDDLTSGYVFVKVTSLDGSGVETLVYVQVM